MQRHSKHKLGLNRETIHELHPAALAAVAGGNLDWSKIAKICDNPPPSNNCNP
jgi:hypothetical protein